MAGAAAVVYDALRRLVAGSLVGRIAADVAAIAPAGTQVLEEEPLAVEHEGRNDQDHEPTTSLARTAWPSWRSWPAG
jgi:hypothetical protein